MQQARQRAEPAESRKSVVGCLLELARIDQWIKNVSLVPGLIVAALFAAPVSGSDVARIAACIVGACLLSSSNYVLNGLMDSASDHAHPVKRTRPLAAQRVPRGAAWAEWATLGTAGVAAAFMAGREVGWVAVVFWCAGLAYNVPPLRAKDLPYVDVVVESVNNPLRLALGWFTLVPDRMPPLSLLFSYWALGAFLLAVKRVAELRFLTSRRASSTAYRHSFAHYSEERLLASAAFHLVLCAFFAGVFIVRFRLELILMVPAAALFLSYYLWLGMGDESPAQSPERVFRRPAMIAYLASCLLLFFVLVRTDLPMLYTLFNVAPASTGALWQIDE